MFKTTVEPGEVVLTDLPEGMTVLYDHDFVKIFELDAVTKYPGPIAHSAGPGATTLIFCAAPESLNLDKEYPGMATRLTFHTPKGETWRPIVSAARYTVEVALFLDRPLAYYGKDV